MEKSENQIVIIGAGNIAALFDTYEDKEIRTHAHAILENDSFELKGFFDVNYQRAQEAASKWNVNAFATLDEAMENADIAVCCVPDEFHYEILMALSKYNIKLVVAEKPLTKTLEQAYELRKRYCEKKIDIVLNYSRRYLEAYVILKEEMKSYGRFLKGTGYYGKGTCHNGSHMIDIVSFLLNDKCEVFDKKNPIEDFSDDDKSYDINLGIAKGIFEMKAIDCRVATIFEMEFFFEKARVRILDSGTKIEIYDIRESDSYKGYFNYILKETRMVDYSGAMKGLYRNIDMYLQNKQKLRCTIDDGISTLEVCMEVGGEE